MKIFLLLFFILTHNIFASDSFKLAYFSVSPHIIDCEKTKPCGALVEYLETQIFNKMKKKVEWIGPLAIPRAVQMLEDGKVDALSLAGKLDKEKKYIYSDRELVKGRWFLLYRGKFLKKRISSGKDLIGINIAFYGSGRKYSHPFLNEPGIVLRPLSGLNWFERNFEMMEKGRVDAMVMPELGPILFIFKKYNVKDRYQVIPFDGDSMDLHIAFSSKSSIGRNFKKAFDEIYDISEKGYEDYLFNFIENMKIN